MQFDTSKVLYFVSPTTYQQIQTQNYPPSYDILDPFGAESGEWKVNLHSLKKTIREADGQSVIQEGKWLSHPDYPPAIIFQPSDGSISFEIYRSVEEFFAQEEDMTYTNGEVEWFEWDYHLNLGITPINMREAMYALGKMQRKDTLQGLLEAWKLLLSIWNSLLVDYPADKKAIDDLLGKEFNLSDVIEWYVEALENNKRLPKRLQEVQYNLRTALSKLNRSVKWDKILNGYFIPFVEILSTTLKHFNVTDKSVGYVVIRNTIPLLADLYVGMEVGIHASKAEELGIYIREFQRGITPDWKSIISFIEIDDLPFIEASLPNIYTLYRAFVKMWWKNLRRTGIELQNPQD